MASQAPQKLTTKQRNGLVWDSMKEEIHQLLIVKGNSLPETRNIIEYRHGFNASERTWKMKLSEWKFKKYIPSADMRFMVNKAEKRLLEENKETILSYQGALIKQRRLDNFKKRKANPDDPVLDVATPAYIEYHTPSAMNSGDMEPRSETAPTIPVGSLTGTDPAASNSMERTLLPESHQYAASNGCNPGTRVIDDDGAVEMALDSQLRRDEPMSSSESSDPSGPETPPVVSNSASSTSNGEGKFPLLRALREESRTTDDHIASFERSRGAFYLYGHLKKFSRYVELPIQGEDLRFLKKVIESVQNNSVAEDYPNLFSSEFLSKDRQPSEFWDEFTELIELVLVNWPSTPQDWHWSRFLELVLSSEAAFGLENWITVSLVCRYADFLVMIESPFPAEDILHMVIAKLPNDCSNLRLHCRLSLAAILFFTQKAREAVTTLVSTIRTDLLYPHQTNPFCYAHLIQSSQLLEFIGPDISPSSESIAFSIIQVQRMVLQNYSGRISLDRTWINALAECARIAEKLSESNDCSLADELLLSITVAIATFSATLHGSKISTIFISLGSHHYRQNKIQEFRKDIWNAYRFLESDTSLDLSAKALLDSMRQRFESLDREGLENIAEELKLIQRDSELERESLASSTQDFPIALDGDELETNEFDDIVLVEDSTVTTQSTIDHARELVISIPIRGDSSWETYAIPRRNIIGQEDTMTSRTSNKYGVTFSVSEMTGISHSEFMVP